MTEAAATATCKREIEMEIPADVAQKATEKVARNFAKVARIPGFRPGKAPIPLIRKRFADDIQGEVLQSLVPEYLTKALDEKKMVPVTRPEVDNVEFKDGEPLKFRAVFEVLPEFELGTYKNLEVKIDDVEAGEPQVDKAIEEMRDRAATFVPAEGRPAKDGDFLLIKLQGTPKGEAGGEPVAAENIMCHIGAEETLEAFTENLRGTNPGDTRDFESKYPDDYPDPKLAGKTFDFKIEVQGIKEKKLPELNDDFAKEVAGEAAGVSTLAEMRTKVRENLEAAKEDQQKSQAREKILETLVKSHDFPVPEALVHHQMDVRLERTVRQLTAQGIDPRQVNVDWASMRERQRDRAIDDVKAELLIDRIADAEKIEVSDEDLDKEIAHLAEHHGGESATALRARLTKQGALDNMKSQLRNNKTIDWLYSNARIETATKSEA
jgi:trigger factor